MANDFRDLILALNKHRVRYVIVGGYAVGVHHDPRTTKDLDVFIATSEEDSKRVFAALQEFGAPLAGYDETFFARQNTQWYQMGRPPFRVDLLQKIDGKDFETAWANRVSGELFGVPVFLISREDLIDNKVAAGREQDLRDVKNLRRY